MHIVKKHNSHQMNMTQGPLGKKILMFALPLAGSSILQQLFNSADVAVVGRGAEDVILKYDKSTNTSEVDLRAGIRGEPTNSDNKNTFHLQN